METTQTHMERWRKLGTGSMQDRHGSAGTSSVPSARQLSLNRARKQAESDMTMANHQRNLQHLYRRMAELESIQDRRKNLFDPAAHPPLKPSARGQRPSASLWSSHGTTSHRYQQQQEDLPTARLSQSCRSSPRTSLKLPAASTASAQQSGRGARKSANDLQGTDGSLRGSLQQQHDEEEEEQGQEWEQLKRAHSPAVVPPLEPLQLPFSRFSGPTLLPSVLYKLHHEALLREILGRQLYKEAAIQSLCREYLTVNASCPQANREVLEKVIADVKQQLEVR